MKKTDFTRYRFVMTLLLTGTLSGTVVAQSRKTPAPKASGENEVRIRITEKSGTDTREIERTYRLDGMTDNQRDKLVMKLVDSLKATRRDDRHRQMTIIVEDNNGNRAVTRENTNPSWERASGDIYAQRNRQPRTNNNDWNSQNWQFEFRRGADSLAERMNRLRLQFPRDFDRQLARPFEDWARNVSSKPSTIRGLDAYPNNPDQNMLNLRFTAPAKGDVLVVVTNPKGKEVARRTFNDFSGEFVGQIDLGRKAQGVYFVTITQNEDGAVKRVVID